MSILPHTLLRRFAMMSLCLYCTVSQAQNPTAPSGLTNEVSSNGVVISWSAATDDDEVGGYNLYRNNQYYSTVFSTETELSLADGLGQTFYVVTFDNPSPDETRSYSTRSESITVQANSVPTEPNVPNVPNPTTPPNTGINQPPSAPTVLSARRESATTVEILWSGAADDNEVAGYNVYRDNAYVATVFGTEYRDTTVAAGTLYGYYVIAFDEPRLFSGRSAIVFAKEAVGSVTLIGQTGTEEPTPTPTPTPTVDTIAPVKVNGLTLSAMSADTITLTWQADNSDATLRGYNVYRNTQYLTTVFATEFKDADVPRDDSVRYSVVAFDNAPNFSVESDTLLVGLNEPSVNLTGNSPGTPKVLLVSNDWVEFQWQPVSNATAYKVYRDGKLLYTVSPNDGVAEGRKFWETNSYIDCNSTRFYERCLLDAPQSGESYHYHVTAIDSFGAESLAQQALKVTLRSNQRSNLQALLNDFSLVFNDDFSGTQLDASKWNTRLPWGPETIINGEQQYFVDVQNSPNFGYDPFNFTGNSLRIEGIATPSELSNDAAGQPFLSGAITTRDSFNFTYGYVESRVKFAKGAGMLSSFFLFHQWAALNSPEIDIAEYLGEQPNQAFQTYHYRDERFNDALHSTPTMSVASDGNPFSDDFHVFSVLWEPDLVVWFIDGEEVLSIQGPEVARQRSYVTMYLVLGSEWTQTPDVNSGIFPGQYEIDYVRVYQRAN